ncbi:hypothetical protein DFJ73DRAFT_779687 [Zopfochytrium polystomum]|nr:hypothetical protein DFJ73DRAFT_779687 [Zopfochytrium polystomum]
MLIKRQDYLPASIVSEIQSIKGIPADQLEPALAFDDDLDFWALYRKRLEARGKKTDGWHVKNSDWVELADEDLQRKLDELEGKRLEAEQEQERQRKFKQYFRLLKLHSLQVFWSSEHERPKRSSSTGERTSASRESQNPVLLEETEDFDAEDPMAALANAPGADMDEMRLAEETHKQKILEELMAQRGELDLSALEAEVDNATLLVPRKTEPQEADEPTVGFVKRRNSEFRVPTDISSATKADAAAVGTERARQRNKAASTSNQLGSKTAVNAMGASSISFKRDKMTEGKRRKSYQGQVPKFSGRRSNANLSQGSRRSSVQRDYGLIEEEENDELGDTVSVTEKLKPLKGGGKTFAELQEEQRGSSKFLMKRNRRMSEAVSEVARPEKLAPPVARNRGPSFAERLAAAGIAVPNSVLAVEVQAERERSRISNRRGLLQVDVSQDASNMTSTQNLANRRYNMVETQKPSFALPPHLRSRRRGASRQASVTPPAVEESNVRERFPEDEDEGTDENDELNGKAAVQETPAAIPVVAIVPPEPSAEPAPLQQALAPREELAVSDPAPDGAAKAPPEPPEDAERTVAEVPEPASTEPSASESDLPSADSLESGEAHGFPDGGSSAGSASTPSSESFSSTPARTRTASPDPLTTAPSSPLPPHSRQASPARHSPPSPPPPPPPQPQAPAAAPKGQTFGRDLRGDLERSKAIAAAMRQQEREGSSAAGDELQEAAAAAARGGSVFEPEVSASQPKTKLEKNAWDLLKDAYRILEGEGSWSVDGRQDLSSALQSAWSSTGMAGKTFNIENILEALFRLLKHGAWREKCEASKAILYLYRTFEKDIPDALDRVLLPQLEFLTDADWRVRAQLCANMGAYSIRHPDVVFSLVCRLNDRVEAVQRAAKYSLAAFGICSKQTLRLAMTRLGMLHSEPEYSPRTLMLEVLLERAAALGRPAPYLDPAILLWLAKQPREIAGPPMDQRPSSTLATLVLPPIRREGRSGPATPGPDGPNASAAAGTAGAAADEGVGQGHEPEHDGSGGGGGGEGFWRRSRAGSAFGGGSVAAGEADARPPGMVPAHLPIPSACRASNLVSASLRGGKRAAIV